jgi:aspartyl protease
MPTLQLISTTCNTPVIELTIAGAKHRFIIDTGATSTILCHKLVNKFKFNIIESGVMLGVGKDTPEILRLDLKFNFVGVCLSRVVVSDRVQYFRMQLPFRVSGLIGQDILSQFSQVCFDYKNKVVRFVG